MSKKNINHGDELWKKGLAASPLAVQIELLVRPAAPAIKPILLDLEKRHGLILRLSWTGIIAEKDGDVIYEDGRYSRVAARGVEQCAEYRRRVFIFLRWCCTHYPTDLLMQNKGWIYGR